MKKLIILILTILVLCLGTASADTGMTLGEYEGAEASGRP